MDRKSAGTNLASQVTPISISILRSRPSKRVYTCRLGKFRLSTGFSRRVQAWAFPVPRVLARTLARWSPSKAPSTRVTHIRIRSSCSGYVQAQVRAGPLQTAAVPATQTSPIVTPLPLETRTACSHLPNELERKTSLLPTATRQAAQIAAPLAQVWAGLCIQLSAVFQHVCDFCPNCAQDHGATSHQHQLPDGSVLELLEMRPPGTDIIRAAQPPLLFLHGASHGAWCWAVSFLSCPLCHVLLPFSCPNWYLVWLRLSSGWVLPSSSLV